MWLVFALLSAIFAALTSILAKVGIEGVNSTLATAIRTGVVLLMAWGMVFLTDTQGGISAPSPAPQTVHLSAAPRRLPASGRKRSARPPRQSD